MPSYSSTHTGQQIDDTVDSAVLHSEILNLIYPVGSIYLSVNSTDPSTFIGGTWERIQDTFLLAAGEAYTAGDVGGTVSHTHTTNAGTTGGHVLTVAELPSHRHDEVILNGDTNWYLGGGNWNSNQRSRHPLFSSSIGSTTTAFYISTSYTGSNNSHTHPQTSVGTSPSSNLPPYLAVYIWKRVA